MLDLYLTKSPQIGIRKFSMGIFYILLSSLLWTCASRKILTKPINNQKAVIIENTLNSLQNQKLSVLIKEWIGTPYKLGGMDKKGIDCSGFAQMLHNQIYGNKLVRRSMDQALQIDAKLKSDLKEGDLIFFSFSGKDIDHVGVYLNNNYFVHASTTKGVIVDDLNLASYKSTLIKCGSVLKK